MIKSLVNNVVYGKKAFQPLFEKLHFISLYGMNIGSPTDVKTSGELFAISLILEKFQEEEFVIVFDVGANQGEFTKAVLSGLKKIKRKLKIFAFEPQKEAYTNFKENIKSSNVAVYNYGFSDTKGKKTFFQNNEISTLSSLYTTDALYEPKFDKERLEIELTTIDDFVEKKQISKIHYLKIDVEGHEFSILQGAKHALQNNKIEIIQFEFGNVNAIAKVFMKDFFDLLGDRYDIYRLLKDGIQKISKYDGKIEIYQTTIYLAIDKKLVI